MASGNGTLKVRRENGKIFSHIRKRLLEETPEERVRQNYLCVLVNEYGFSLDQIDEELELTGRGTGRARADFVVWRSAQDKIAQNSPLLIVECKSDNVTITAADYSQGDNYARISNAPFFVTHNSRETRYWRVLKEKMPGFIEEIENIPHADASNDDIKELISKLKVFKENEFADLLHQCHNVIRNRDHEGPVEAFDEIAKIMFVKVWVERELKEKRRRVNVFTVAFLKEQLGPDPLNDLFERTKIAYKKDQIFSDDARINLKPATSEEIVRLLERYNLSETSEDVKGIAFERYLGKTFRDDNGQFFTPRCIVEFTIWMLEPKEGDTICDPASGSGGFLIRFFEIVREQIMADVDRQYQDFKKELEAKTISNGKKAEALRAKYDELAESINRLKKGSRTWELANACIFGSDANERMARTSKMNMIMHGDGHGGIYHHNGFININGIFEGRFNVVLTNPPFGASVESTDVITEDQIKVSEDEQEKNTKAFGSRYKEALDRVVAAVGKPIGSLYELPKGKNSKCRTEVLFMERCLALLVAGGRMGIVLPEGIFNNPSLAYVREFCEDRARILAVVSLPQETFISSGASVKASLLFLAKFTEQEQADYESKRFAAIAEKEAEYADEIERRKTLLESEIEAAKQVRDFETLRTTRRELRVYLAEMTERKKCEARALLKERFDYPIFLYEAEKVGITATGDADTNELFPNPNMPAGMKPEETCLELYRRFCKSPGEFALPRASGGEQ